MRKNKTEKPVFSPKKRKNIIISIIVFISFIAISFLWILNAQAAYTLKKNVNSSGGYGGHGTSSHKTSADASHTFCLSNIGFGNDIGCDLEVGDSTTHYGSVVFCTDPNRAAEEVNQGYISTDASSVTKLHYNFICTGGTNDPSDCVSESELGSTTIGSEERKAISLFAAYYNLNYNTKSNNAAARTAVQMLIWEVATGARYGNSLDDVLSNIKPKIAGDTSWYEKYIKGKTTSTDVGKAYKAAYEYAKNYNATPTGMSGKHKLTWSTDSNVWTTTITGGDYSKYTCSTSASGVTVTNNGSSLVVTSNTYYAENNAQKISCKRDDDGVSKGGEGIWYCRSNGDTTNPACADYYQKLVRGATPGITKELSVWTEGVLVKVIKQDESGNSLDGSEFTFTGSKTYKISGNNSTAVVVVPGTYSIEETTVPEGYSAMPKLENISIQPSANNYGDEGGLYSYNASTNTFTLTVRDIPLILNWYKVTERNILEKEATFTLSGTSGSIGHQAEKINVPAGGETRSCYKYSSAPTVTTDNPNPYEYVSDGNGQVCVIGLPKDTYTITETNPGKYHTFGNTKTKTITIDENSTTFAAMDNSASAKNKYINYPTEFIFTKNIKNVNGGDGTEPIDINGETKTLTEATDEELKKLRFQIYVRNSGGAAAGSPFKFYYDSETGAYENVQNDIDGPNVEGTDLLQLTINTTDNSLPRRYLKVLHLPAGSYVIREYRGNSCENNEDTSNCIGYYYPNYTDNSASAQTYRDSAFEITTCSNPSATSCGNGSAATQSLVNVPTKMDFTKNDFYHYENRDDIVDFETDAERSDFDRIKFKLQQSNGEKNLTLKFVKNEGNCKDNNSYSLYRYVPGDDSDGEEGTDLYACGGHIRVTNLCRGKEYIMKEVEVPENSVFVREEKQNPNVDTPIQKKFTVPCEEGPKEDSTNESTTVIINDKGTRVKFEKRDSKYNYLIPDETTTFEVYRCITANCHPTEERVEGVNDYKLVKFAPRQLLEADDGTDHEDNGYEVYPQMSDSDVKKCDESGQKGCYVTDLHPDRGRLILRYLEGSPANEAEKYNYVLVETVAPKNYTLPEGTNAETKFTVTTKTVAVNQIDVPNKPTSILIKKYNENGTKLLPGAEFKIYQSVGTKCDPTVTAKNQNKTLVNLKTIRDGVYEARPIEDTSVIKTCLDKEGEPCNNIAANVYTKLTYAGTVHNYDGNTTDKGYEETWAAFENESTKTENGEKIKLQQGEALIQYLEYGHCYIIEETKAPEGYSLPENEDDRYTMVTIEENDMYAHDTSKVLKNKPTSFQFYKFDEFNKLLDGAEFKLQKLNKDKKYEDVTVTKVEEKDENYYYKVDKTSNETKILTHNGTAIVYYLTEGQYRILETSPAPGKELGKNPNVATFFVDNNGVVYGNSTIINKEKTTKIEVPNSAKAELVVNIQTGQPLIKYGLIITGIAAIIAGLLLLKKKTK